MADNGVTPSELAKARKSMKTDLAEGTQTVADLIMNISQYVSHGRVAHELGNRLALFQDVTSADIQAVAKKYLGAEAAHDVTIRPKSEKPKVAAKSGQPKFGGKLTDQEKAKTLAEGTEVVVREKPGDLNLALTVKALGRQSPRPKTR